MNVRRAITKLTHALASLCVPDEGNCELQVTLSHIAQEIGPTAAQFRITTEGLARALRPTIRDEVYRIGREGLLNAFRHSQASQIEAELYFAPNHFGMLIRDNGCGVDSGRLSNRISRHGGLLEMLERAEGIGARIRVMSRVAVGTEIQLSLSGGVAFDP